MDAPDAARAPSSRARELLALLGLLCFAPGCATVWQGLTPQGPPAETESARRLRAGPWKVAREDLRLVDASRTTPAHHDLPAAPERRVRARS